MNNIKELVEYGVLGLLLALSVWAVAIAIDRFYHYRRIDVAAWDKRVELEADLTA